MHQKHVKTLSSDLTLSKTIMFLSWIKTTTHAIWSETPIRSILSRMNDESFEEVDQTCNSITHIANKSRSRVYNADIIDFVIQYIYFSILQWCFQWLHSKHLDCLTYFINICWWDCLNYHSIFVIFKFIAWMNRMAPGTATIKTCNIFQMSTGRFTTSRDWRAHCSFMQFFLLINIIRDEKAILNYFEQYSSVIWNEWRKTFSI